MKIILTRHAIIRLLERNIDAWKAKEVVKNPSWQKRQKDGSIAARKDFDGKTIEVIYVLEGRDYVIKTAYPCE
jgi:hypothetical protein